jgi:uncharacterized membrane protein
LPPDSRGLPSAIYPHTFDRGDLTMTTMSPAAPVATRTIGLKHVALAVFVFMTLFVLYGRDLQLLDAGSELRQRYVGVPWWMLAHGIFGALALFLAPFQFSTRLRQRYTRVHRITGRIYIAGAMIAAVAAVPVVVTLGPPTLVMAATIQSAAWIVTTAVALYCIRTGRIQQHREWMMRSYAFAVVFLVTRVILAIPAIQELGEVGLVSVVWSTIALALFLPSFLIALQSTLASKSMARAAAR